MNEETRNFPEVNNRIINKKEIQTPILNKNFENAYAVPINKMKLGGNSINQSQNELFTQSCEEKALFVDSQIQRKNNKWDILGTIIKNQSIPAQNQIKRNYLPYIPTSIPDLVKRSINKNYEQKVNLNHSEIVGGLNKFTTPSPPKTKKPIDLINRFSPVKDFRNPITISSTFSGITATKINTKNFYVQAKKY